MQIHLDPATINDLAQLAVPLVLAIGGVLWKLLDNHSPLKNSQADDIARQAFMDLLDKGAQFGASQVASKLTMVGNIDVGHPAIAAGANFVLAHGPELAARMGFDISTDAGRAAIIRSVTARLGPYPHMQELESDAPNETDIHDLTLPPRVALAGSPTAVPLGPQPPSKN